MNLSKLFRDAWLDITGRCFFNEISLRNTCWLGVPSVGPWLRCLFQRLVVSFNEIEVVLGGEGKEREREREGEALIAEFRLFSLSAGILL